MGDTYAFLALPVFFQGLVIHVVDELLLHLRRMIVLDSARDSIAKPLAWFDLVD